MFLILETHALKFQIVCCWIICILTISKLNSPKWITSTTEWVTSIIKSVIFCVAERNLRLTFYNLCCIFSFSNQMLQANNSSIVFCGYRFLGFALSVIVAIISYVLDCFAIQDVRQKYRITQNKKIKPSKKGCFSLI